MVAAVGRGFRLTGAGGIDFISTPAGPVLIEVNPRYTAATELFELHYGVCALAKPGDPDSDTHVFTRIGPVIGKAVYHAARSLTVPAAGPWDDSTALAGSGNVWVRPDFADIPQPGEVIEQGQPVVTLLADGPTETAVLATLKARAADLDRLFGVPTPEDSP